MASPPVLLSTATFFPRPISWTFPIAAEAGFRAVEVMVTTDPDTQEPDRTAALAAEHGLRVRALHAPCLLVTRAVWSRDPIRKIERSLDAAAALDAPVVIAHPPYRWQRGYRRWLVQELPGVEAATGVAVAIENMFPIRVGRRAVAFHADHDLHELDGLPHVALDTSHAAVAGHDPVDVRRRFGDRLRHVHLSDNAGRGWDSHLPPGEGVLDLDAFLEDLSASSYPGAVSLEVDLRPALAREEPVVDLLISMRERVEARLGDAVRRGG